MPLRCRRAKFNQITVCGTGKSKRSAHGLCSTVVTDLLKDSNNHIIALTRDRPEGDLKAKVVVTSLRNRTLPWPPKLDSVQNQNPRTSVWQSKKLLSFAEQIINKKQFNTETGQGVSRIEIISKVAEGMDGIAVIMYTPKNSL